jgi:hypothetical protein
VNRIALYRAGVTPVMLVMVGHAPIAPWPRKSPHRCDYCGSQTLELAADNPTRTIWRHERCETAWYDSNGLPEGAR